MNLNVSDRITALGLLPTESNYVTLKVVREAQEKLALSSDELTTYDVKADENKITWNDKGAEEVDIALSAKAIEIVADSLKRLDGESKLNGKLFRLYEKFICG